jgi:hypothetical protein
LGCQIEERRDENAVILATVGIGNATDAESPEK